tara:strand:- start:21559 stop:22461 length:903 start_codon:yes stop_codon:yes gene_type:complete
MSNSKDAYNDVELSLDEELGLEGIDEQTTMSENEPKDETQENSVLEDSNESSKPSDEGATNLEVISSSEFEMDGHIYDRETINQWKNDADNKTQWNKSNTEKSQKIAKVGKFLQRIESDKEFSEHIKDYFYDNPEEYNKLGLDEKLSELVPNEEASTEEITENPLEGRLNKLEQAENDRIIDSRVDTMDRQLTQLEERNPNSLGSPEKVDEFLQFAESNSERYRDANGLVNLEAMFKNYSYDTMKDELDHYKKLDDNRSRNSKVKVGTSEIGATETVAPKKYDSWKDVTADDPEISKYFE